MISVLMPVRNAQNTVVSAVQSVRSQKDVGEVIVVDDGSTDATVEQITWERDNANCTVPLHILTLSQHRRGVGAALNAALAHARFDLLLRQDADDLSFKGRVAGVMVGWWPCVGAVSSWFAAEHEGGNVKGAAVHAFPPTLSVYDLLSGWRFPHGPAMYRREALESVGGWPEDMETSEDHLLHLRLAEKYGPLPIVPTPLYFVGDPPTRQSRTKDVKKWDRIAEERFAWKSENPPSPLPPD